jgi:hypothetical protein
MHGGPNAASIAQPDVMTRCESSSYELATYRLARFDDPRMDNSSMDGRSVPRIEPYIQTLDTVRLIAHCTAPICVFRGAVSSISRSKMSQFGEQPDLHGPYHIWSAVGCPRWTPRSVNVVTRRSSGRHVAVGRFRPLLMLQIVCLYLRQEIHRSGKHGTIA